MNNKSVSLDTKKSKDARNNIENNSNLEFSLIFFVLYITSLFCLYNCWVNAVGLISDEFASIIEMTPIILSYFLPSVYLIVLFRNLYFKKFSKGGLISFLIVTTILIIGSLVLMIIKYNYHFNNFINHYKNYFSPLDNVFLLVGLLIVNIFLFIRSITNKIKFDYRDPICPGIFNTYSWSRMFAIGFYLIFSGFSFINGFKGALIFNNFVNYPLGYSLLILTSILPMVCFMFYLFFNPKKKLSLILYLISLVLFIFSLTGLLIMQYLSDGLLTSQFDQNLFRITYAGSVPAQYMLFGLILIFNIVSFIVSTIHYKNENN